MNKIFAKTLTLFSLFIITSTMATPIQFDVKPDGAGKGVWSFSSDEPRPMLYLVTLKSGSEDPKNCDDGTTLFAVRDVLSFESQSFNWPSANSATVQLCVLNLHGFVEQRLILSFNL
jgi:hypothetical protein